MKTEKISYTNNSTPNSFLPLGALTFALTVFASMQGLQAAELRAPETTQQLKEEAFVVVDQNAEQMGKISDAIYSFSEIGFQEYKTIALVEETLSAAGFVVETGVADMPTAYMASYGSGEPVIGLMSDFDGVPGTSQNPVALAHEPLIEGAPGHGEGHNTHQPTLIGAALAFKAIKDNYDLPGTLIVYGGPAEELLASRGYMVKAGLFEGVDAVLDVHVGTEFGTSWGLNNFANATAQWTFNGRQAHGARPYQGRSALDGVALMNVGVNMMREHGYEPQDARIHYVITDGGTQPNVVPGTATVWYYFRAKSPEIVQSMLDWTTDIADGSALSTHTSVTRRIMSASWPVNGNKELAALLQKNIELVGMPEWSADDIAFAEAYQKSMGAEIVGLPTEVEPLQMSTQGSSTSDAGDISWNVPYVRMYVPAKPEGALAGHHWSAGIGPATPIAHKGIAAGSKALVASILDLMTDPAALDIIAADFEVQLSQWPAWSSLIPDGAMPPTHLNTDEMARYRAALADFEYDPASEESYLEFLGVDYPPEAPETAIGRASNAVLRTPTESSIDWEWTPE